ncbi:MAG: YiiX/YebB-like N1pC/P60 family cysteine hydrolase [Betaproteobacteria bacterium]
MNRLLRYFGERLADYLSQPLRTGAQVALVPPELVAALLRPGDVMLVEGRNRVSVAIKYLTQSTWSHAALYIGDALGPPPHGEEPRVLIEAAMREGVRAVPLSNFAQLNTRICRPVGLTADDRKHVVGYAIGRIGQQYDLSHLFDLARYLLPTPPVPARLRRRLLAVGSGDPTRAICSTLIAQAFQSIRYPILPDVTRGSGDDPHAEDSYRELMHIRKYGLYAPRDFDLSPYFGVVKPALAYHFDFHRLHWADDPPPDAGGVPRQEDSGRI